MIFQILEISRIELKSSMNSNTICFTLLVVFSFFSGAMYITNQTVDALKEINKHIFKDADFEVDDNSLVSYEYDTINQDNNYNHIEYSGGPSIPNYPNDYSYNNHYDYSKEFVAPLDPYPVISDNGYYYLDSHGMVYLSFDYSLSVLSYKVFVEGMSYLDGDDVEIIEVHLGTYGQNGPSILSLCNEKIKVGHCREGPGLSVEGIVEEKDLTGPLKGSSFSELIEFFTSGQSYVYVQSRDHPDGEMRGQIHYY